MRLSNKRLREGLRNAAPPAEMRSGDDFWADFRARSELVPQQHPEAVRSGKRREFRGWAVVGGTAAALLIAIFSLWTVVLQSSDGDQPELSSVEEIAVFAECSSVLVFEDEENEGTLVWLAGLQQAGPVPGDNGHEIL